MWPERDLVSNQYSSLLKMQDSVFNVNHKVNIWWMGQIYLDTGISPAVLACQGRSKASKPKGKIALTLDWWIKDNYSFTEEWLMQMFSANQESTLTPVCLQSTQSVMLYEFYCPLQHCFCSFKFADILKVWTLSERLRRLDSFLVQPFSLWG